MSSSSEVIRAPLDYSSFINCSLFYIKAQMAYKGCCLICSVTYRNKKSPRKMNPSALEFFSKFLKNDSKDFDKN